MQISKKSLIWKYIAMILELMPQKTFVALILTVFISLTEGISLLLLVPLLQLVGLDVQQGALGQISGFISSFFSLIGIKPTLTSVLIIYVIVISLNAYLYKLQMIKSSNIQYEFAARLRNQLFSSITYSSWLFFIKKRSSDFAHSLTYEIERVTSGTGQFLSLVATCIVLAVYVIFALRLSGIITGLIFIVGVTLLLILKKKTQSAGVSGAKLSKTSKNMYSSTIKQLDGMKTIRSFNMEEKNIEIFKDVSNDVFRKYMDAIKSYADVKFLFDVGSVVVLSIIVFILVNTLSIPTAELLILLFLFVRMIPKFSTIQRSYQYFINMLPAFETIIRLENECKITTELENKTKKVKLKDGIIFKNVSFSYEKSLTLKNVNINIKENKTTAIVGLSGAGKSTIADMIMGLIVPDKGEIIIDKTPLNKNNIRAWRNQIGYVSQDIFLFNDTIKNNLLVGKPDATEEEISEALKLASADEFIYNLHKGLDTVIGDRGVLLSGGEKQRLAFARALLRKPALLILDEATSNLDSKNEKKILNSIEKLHNRISILIIAHRLSTIRNADFIYLIEKGQIVESGSWNDLISHENSHFNSLYKIQKITESKY